MNRDFVEMLSELPAAGAEFLVVDAHALAAHGVPRATGDIDIWIRPIPENADRVLGPLTKFVLAREDFIANKRATGRPKDLSDLALLAGALPNPNRD